MAALFFDDIMAFHEMIYQQRPAETEKEVKYSCKHGTRLIVRGNEAQEA